MKPNFQSMWLLPIVAMMNACSPVLYSTIGQNVPMFTEKGEVALSGGYALSYGDDFTDAEGLSLQVAAAIDSNLAVSGSLYTLHNETGSSDWNGKGSYFEFGIGKFGHIKQSKSMLVGEIFIGLGAGKIKNTHTNQKLEVNFLKPFIQPTGGITTNAFDILFTPRIGLVNYTSTTNQLTDPSQEREINSFFENKKTTLIFEPGLTLRLGYKNFKLQYQYNYSTFNSKSENYAPVNNRFGSLSLFILASKRYEKK